MVSVIVSDPIITKFLVQFYVNSCQHSTFILPRYWPFLWFMFSFNDWLFIAESIFSMAIGKFSGEQYPSAARSCYISKTGTVSGLEPSTFITGTIYNYCLVGSRSWLEKGYQTCTFSWIPAKFDSQGEPFPACFFYLSNDLEPEHFFFLII